MEAECPKYIRLRRRGEKDRPGFRDQRLELRRGRRAALEVRGVARLLVGERAAEELLGQVLVH